MNYSSKFLGYIRYRDVSVPEKACTGEYRVCLFVSIYSRLLMSGRSSSAVLARVLERDHFIGDEPLRDSFKKRAPYSI